jgi:dephospho-CoA kinase
MLRIGLTGGIGSGKSLVAKMFGSLDVPVIDADVIAREVVANHVNVSKQIIQRFGNLVVNNDGTLDRNKLRKIIFVDKVARQWLEALLHPLIIQKMQYLLAQITSAYCILVIPLLIEATEPYTLVDRILLVDTPEELQVERAIKRDYVTEGEVRQILVSQATREQRLQTADEVIVNDRDLHFLAEEVKRLHAFYLELAKE